MQAAPHLQPAPIHVSDTDLEDLRRRLRDTRWPAPLPYQGWEAGVDLDVIREFCRRWADDYDWRRHEAWLNSLNPVRTTVNGIDLHVWQAEGSGDEAMPVLLLHGWPGSVVEFRHVIEPLTQGDTSYKLVMPSLPGFGFGGAPPTTGWGVARIAETLHTLMSEALGHEQYAVHGGDWGAFIGSQLIRSHPESVIGFHTTLPLAPADFDAAWSADLTTQEAEFLAATDRWNATGRGYSAIQSTKPQTVGVGLADSPAGLAAWILEKFHLWSDGGLSIFDPDDLLTNLMFYWAPRSATTAAATYFESRIESREPLREISTVRVGVSSYPREIVRVSRRWVAQKYNLTYWSELDRGGHFPALEQPAAWAADVRAFLSSLT